MRARFFALLRFLLGLGLMLAIVWWLLPGPQGRAELISSLRPDPLFLLLGFLATLITCLVTSARWQMMSEQAMGGTPLPYLVYFHGLVLTRVLGQVSSTLVMDLVGRGVALRSAGSRRGLGHAVTQAVVERIFDIVLPFMMIVWALLVWPSRHDIGLVSASFALACILFTALSTVSLAPLTRVALRIYAALQRLRARRRGEPDPATTALATDPLPAPIALSRALALRVGVLSLARYLSVLSQLWAVAIGVGVSMSFFQISAAMPIGQLAGTIGFTPGALGIQEAGWLGAFTRVGLDAVSIGLFILSQRLIITVFVSVLTLFSWLLLRRRRAAAARAAA